MWNIIKGQKIKRGMGRRRWPLSGTNGTDKGAWGMPRLSEAKKDVTSCEKPRVGANIP